MPIPMLFATILAMSVPPVRVAATAAPVICSSTPKACRLFKNSSTGSALDAAASGDDGFYGFTTSGSYLAPGIDGESDTVTGSDAAAAFGLNFLTENLPPTYGALAYGGINGLYGATESSGSKSNTDAAGVFGQDDGVTSYPDDNAGVLGASSVGTGVLAEGNGTPNSAYFAGAPTGLYAVGDGVELAGGGYSEYAFGLVAESDSIPALAINPSSGYAITFGGPSILDAQALQSGGSRDFFSVDNAGNAYFSGTVSASRGPDLKTTGASGTSRIAYGSRFASPEIEDVGRAHLTAGRAYVTIDAALGDSIDMRRPYHVFVTPEGDCRGLYVTQKSPGGFVVRELRGGRSSLIFDYRIVGKPFDDDHLRLATAVRHRPLVTPGLGPVHARAGRPVSLAARLRLRRHPERVTPASTTVTCNVSTPCALFDNTSTGPALEASSIGGAGLLGATASGSYLEPGIDGESGTASGSDAAATFGLNALTHGLTPTYGALSYGGLNGLYGATENSGASQGSFAAGVFGQDDGASAAPDYNAGVLGVSTVGTGVLAKSHGRPSASGPFGTVPIGTYAVGDSAGSGIGSGLAYGAVAESNDCPFLADGGGDQYFAYLAVTGELLYVSANDERDYFEVRIDGSARFTGVLNMSQGPDLRTTGASGNARIAYGSRAASPEIEDIGTARMTAGVAYVALDPALADSIDMRRPYQVFVTPGGDSKGLYVTQESPRGFAVREAGGGRSTLAFDYRIVGKPFDDNRARLALAPSRPPSARNREVAGRSNSGVPLSPEARLRERLGPQGYARALARKGWSR